MIAGLSYRRSIATPWVRLYCLPYAGGSAASYLGWVYRLPPGVELRPVELAGRGMRAGETPHLCASRLSAEIAAHIVQERDPLPYVLFGHSMGGLLAYETAQELRGCGGPSPQSLVISSARSPDRWTRDPVQLHRASDAALVAMLREQGGTPTEFFDHPDLVARALPVLRADLQVCETYPDVVRPPLAVPIDVLAGRDDGDIDEADLVGWRRRTSAECTVRWFDGGHFYYRESPDALLAALTAALSCARQRSLSE